MRTERISTTRCTFSPFPRGRTGFGMAASRKTKMTAGKNLFDLFEPVRTKSGPSADSFGLVQKLTHQSKIRNYGPDPDQTFPCLQVRIRMALANLDILWATLSQTERCDAINHILMLRRV